MKAAQIAEYGPIEMVKVCEGVQRPTLQSLPPYKRKDYLILKTLAVSLAPGDVRTLSGKTRELQGPPSFPYIPGGDCCGVVEEVSDEKGFYDRNWQIRKGDMVAARFFDFPRNCLAEYALVHKAVCDVCQKESTPSGLAALVSATPATILSDHVKEGERVLVHGAGGGVGSHLCQLLASKASYLAATTTDPRRLLKLGCDCTVDYSAETPWTRPEFVANKFDVVIDLGGGGWLSLVELSRNKVPSIVKSAREGGRYVTTTPDNPIFELHSIWAAVQLILLKSLWRALVTRTFLKGSLPAYGYAMCLPGTREVVTQTLQLAREGTLRPCFEGPFPFTTQGVRRAFQLQESRHAKGKVVIEVAKE